MNPALSGSDPAGSENATEHDVEGWHLRIAEERVWVGDLNVPRFLEIELAGDASEPSVSARIEVIEGAPRITALRFEAKPGEGEVRQSHLRDTQVDALLDLLAGFSLQFYEKEDGGLIIETGTTAEGDIPTERLDALRRSRSNRKMTPEFLRQVAEVYRANIDAGPTRAVRDRFFVSQRMASNYVQRARQAGLLPQTSPGKKRA